MAIADIAAYAHLSSADIEALGDELDAIRRDVEDSLGEKDAAYSAAQKAIALRPSVDAVVGASFEEALARIKARFGDTDGAIADLRRLLGTNYLGPEQIALTPALLRLDPAWIPLRNDPRFEKLLASPAAK